MAPTPQRQPIAPKAGGAPPTLLTKADRAEIVAAALAATAQGATRTGIPPRQPKTPP